MVIWQENQGISSNETEIGVDLRDVAHDVLNGITITHNALELGMFDKIDFDERWIATFGKSAIFSATWSGSRVKMRTCSN